MIGINLAVTSDATPACGGAIDILEIEAASSSKPWYYGDNRALSESELRWRIWLTTLKQWAQDQRFKRLPRTFPISPESAEEQFMWGVEIARTRVEQPGHVIDGGPTPNPAEFKPIIKHGGRIGSAHMAA